VDPCAIPTDGDDNTEDDDRHKHQNGKGHQSHGNGVGEGHVVDDDDSQNVQTPWWAWWTSDPSTAAVDTSKPGVYHAWVFVPSRNVDETNIANQFTMSYVCDCSNFFSLDHIVDPKILRPEILAENQ